MHQAAETPNVATEAVGLPLQDFRSNVPRSADFEERCICWRGKFDSAAQVSNAHLGLLTEVGHENVLHFDVAVKDVSLVQTLNPDCNLNDYSPCLGLRQRLHGLLHQVVQEITCRHEFGHYVVIDGVLESFDVLEDVHATHHGALAQDLQLLKLLTVLGEGALN